LLPAWRRIARPFAEVASLIQDDLGILSEYVTDIPWQERERLFDEGKDSDPVAVSIAWLVVLHQ
jgi:hypothetical protein